MICDSSKKKKKKNTLFFPPDLVNRLGPVSRPFIVTPAPPYLVDVLIQAWNGSTQPPYHWSWKLCACHARNPTERLAFLGPTRLKHRQILAPKNCTDRPQCTPSFPGTAPPRRADTAVSSYTQNKELGNTRTQRNIVWMKQQEKTAEKDINKMEISIYLIKSLK